MIDDQSAPGEWRKEMERCAGVKRREWEIETPTEPTPFERWLDEQSVKAPDMINAPPHYQLPGNIEACDIAKGLMTEEEWLKHCWATAMYYVLRMGRKGSSSEDAAKARWWLHWVEKGDPRK